MAWPWTCCGHVRGHGPKPAFVFRSGKPTTQRCNIRPRVSAPARCRRSRTGYLVPQKEEGPYSPEAWAASELVAAPAKVNVHSAQCTVHSFSSVHTHSSSCMQVMPDAHVLYVGMHSTSPSSASLLGRCTCRPTFRVT